MTERYYTYDDRNLIVYYSDELPENPNLIYLGTSDNPNPSMAAAVFLKNGKIQSGFRLRKLE